MQLIRNILFLVLLAMPVLAQAPAGMQAPTAAEKEIMVTQMRIMQVQQQAFQDPAIQKMQKSLQDDLEKDMIKQDKKIAPKLKRFHELEAEVKKLAESGSMDQTKGQALMQEAQALAGAISPIQFKLMESKKYKKRVEKLQTAVEAKMKVLDPEIPALMVKMEKAIKAAQAKAAAPAPKK